MPFATELPTDSHKNPIESLWKARIVHPSCRKLNLRSRNLMIWRTWRSLIVIQGLLFHLLTHCWHEKEYEIKYSCTGSRIRHTIPGGMIINSMRFNMSCVGVIRALEWRIDGLGCVCKCRWWVRQNLGAHVSKRWTNRKLAIKLWLLLLAYTLGTITDTTVANPFIFAY